MTRRAVQPALPLVVPADARRRCGPSCEPRSSPGWGLRAACASRRVDPDWWFAPADDELQTVARGVCADMPGPPVLSRPRPGDG